MRSFSLNYDICVTVFALFTLCEGISEYGSSNSIPVHMQARINSKTLKIIMNHIKSNDIISDITSIDFETKLKKKFHYNSISKVHNYGIH